MDYDCHVHSTFSPDGSSNIGEYCRWVDEGKLGTVGFAEHLDFLPVCGAYGFLNYKEYINAIQRFRDKGYDFYAGAEVDYVKRVEEDIKKRLAQEQYDFTICSIHTVNERSVSDREIDYFYDRSSFLSLLEGYYSELKWGLAVEEFDVIGHIGVYRRYLEDSFYDVNLRKLIEDFEFETARLCAQSHKIVEVNSSGLFATMASSVPDLSFLNNYYALGGRRVCMSSDAHNAQNAGRGFDRIRELLLQVGFEYLHLPWGPVVKLE